MPGRQVLRNEKGRTYAAAFEFLSVSILPDCEKSLAAGAGFLQLPNHRVAEPGG
jgi:hypothetical protein